jgi:O-acetylhomoserine/O-acetylserine sulfhydrylase-like pyridoxal-dependent enzyme
MRLWYNFKQFFPPNFQGGTNEFLQSVATKYGIQVTFADSTNLQNFEKNIQENTKMIYGETPANPTSIFFYGNALPF